MYTTLVRLAIREGKRKTRWYQTMPLLYEPDLSSRPDPEDAALAAISASDCKKALATMSRLERSVSVLCWVLGYSGAEVARILHEKTETVRGAKKRARDKLLAQVGADAIKYWSQEDEASKGGTT